MSHLLRKIYHRALRAFGDPMLHELRRPWIQRLNIRGIIDVGANEGQFASLARAAFPHAAILSFEPLPDCHGQLQRKFRRDPKFTSVNAALGAADGEADMYSNEFSASSSMLPMAANHIDAFPFTAKVRPKRVRLLRLDGVEAALSLPQPILLKIDVQGYEREVLDGASATLARSRVVIMELSLVELYKNEPLFDDMLARMRTHGFRLAGFAGLTRRPRDAKPLQADAIFEPLST
jgi:FkbM family methyltransferase